MAGAEEIGDGIGEGDSPRGRIPSIDERTPLLPRDPAADTSVTSLYRTLSRSSDAADLPPDDDDLELAKEISNSAPERASGVYSTITVLLLGAFVANVDASLVLATYGRVASDFNDLHSGSWLLSSFILAQCVAQPLYGKLSEIYGRKACLQFSYFAFALGTAGAGLGQSMTQVIVWRAVQGCGSAGMTSLVSIIVADEVPIHEVATIRSYVNILQTAGRSCGGVIGGALTYSLGWRWTFLVQVPPTVLALVLVQKRLHLAPRESSGMTQYQKLKRIDFIGSVFLCLTIFAACFILETGGQRYPWNSTTIHLMAITCAVSLVAFVISANLVAEPIFPLRLMRQWGATSSYLIAFLQVLLQFSLISIVPLYFQVTNRANTAQAGAYLLPTFAGNSLGGLISGYFIKHTGLYKPITVTSPLFALLGLVIIYFTWNGNTSWVGALAIFPGGFASGMVSSSIFVGLATDVDEGDMAIAASGLYLFFNLGAVAGASAGGALYQTSLRAMLAEALAGVENGAEIVQRALSDISYVQNASDQSRQMIIPAYVYGLHQVSLQSGACALIWFAIAVLTPHSRLRRK